MRKAAKEMKAFEYNQEIKPAYFPPGGDSSFVPDREDNSVIYMDISTEGGRELKTKPVTYSLDDCISN